MPEVSLSEELGGIMTEETFRTRIAELETRITALPADQQAQLKGLIEETRQRYSDIRRSVSSARDALDDWRIAMKYLIFDQEARLREARQ